VFKDFRTKLASYKIHKRHNKIQAKYHDQFIDKDNDRVDDKLEEIIEAAGYSYDENQDIFYSNMNAWQRDMGYCRLYDEGSALFGMIIDCEPIYFEYKGRRWLIEFWKGQYDLPTGAEIGVYSTDKPDIDIPDVFKGPFFHSVGDEDALDMSFTLWKKGKKLFTREGKHWWLTGFKLGLFSEPYELQLELSITLKDEEMLKAFVKGLKKAGYSDGEMTIEDYTISLIYDKPHTVQPATRTPEGDLIIQWKNKLLCEKYNEITKHYDNFPDQVKAIYNEAPELYEKIINIDKTKRLFTRFEKLAEFLGQDTLSDS
jgi:hypothetical protein